MKSIFTTLLNRASDLVGTEPILGFFLAAALLCVFIAAYSETAVIPDPKPTLLWTLYHHARRFLRAALIVSLLVGAVTILRVYLRHSVAHFQRTHGRVTQANYNAVQTIWGPEQTQGELKVEIYTDEEVTERIESEDLTKPAVLRKKTVRRFATGNPFTTARHQVTLRQNSRKKGSAIYGGYETDCRFQWNLKNPATASHNCTLTFPLPSPTAMYDDLAVTLNGQDVLPQIQIKESALVLSRIVNPNETMDLRLSFKSRGMAFWYFQVREAREIRDFTLTLNLPDLPREKLNYPEGCMTPTAIAPTADRAGAILTYRLDHALSSKGTGVALPELPQPGAITNAVLGETDRAWLLLFAMFALSFTLTAAPNAPLLTLGFGAATAFAYGLLGNFSDLLFGFWGTAGFILVPFFVIVAFLLVRATRSVAGRLVVQTFVFGIIYPCAAGLDPDRQPLYLDLCAVAFLCFAVSMIKSPNDARLALVPLARAGQ